MSYGAALDFAQQVGVPFRLVLSQRLFVPAGRGNGVAALLSGGKVTIPRLRRDAHVLADAALVPDLLDCAERAGLFGIANWSPVFRPLRECRHARVRAVVGRRSPLSASFFRSERSYDLVFDLYPVCGDAFAWRGVCFFLDDSDGIDNVPLWVSGPACSLSSSDLAEICSASRRAFG